MHEPPKGSYSYFSKALEFCLRVLFAVTHITLSVFTSLKLFALYIFLESLTTVKNQNLSISFIKLRSDNKKDITNL